MNTLRAALALGLFAAGCADAHAQPRRDAGAPPRRDAGAARRWIFPSREPLLRNPFRGDGGAPYPFLPGPTTVSDIHDDFAIATATSAGPPAPAVDAEAVGTIGSPASQGRFADAERVVGVPVRDARIWLTVSQGWVLRCLERVRSVTPFDVPVRFSVARDGTVVGVTAEGAPEGALPCLVEGLGHARFQPVAQPAEIVARYRYTVRWRPPPVSGARRPVIAP
ncbi:MAG: hypothetical protein Q8S73_09775 [Deltaproteobacteria bacterium]|nr:hypothetical protein [Myxococcales bacterium]MDP3214381.1 hypothetical protein [Deltaproteobacteria bacterium]